MKKEKKTNIFDTASKTLGKGKKEVPTPTKTEPQPPTQTVGDTHRDPEIREMLQKIEFMRQDLVSKMELIQQRSGMTPEGIQKFMDDPKNFSNEEWANLQKSKDLLGERVWNALGQELKPKPIVRENIAGERKGKTLGARKKWIPMK